MASPPRQYANAEQQITSTGTGDVHTITLDTNTRYVMLSAETTSARVTFAGGAPSSSLGHVIPTGAIPLYLPVGKGTTIKFASTGATACVLNLTELTN